METRNLLPKCFTTVAMDHSRSLTDLIQEQRENSAIPSRYNKDRAAAEIRLQLALLSLLSADRVIVDSVTYTRIRNFTRQTNAGSSTVSPEKTDPTIALLLNQLSDTDLENRLAELQQCLILGGMNDVTIDDPDSIAQINRERIYQTASSQGIPLKYGLIVKRTDLETGPTSLSIIKQSIERYTRPNGEPVPLTLEPYFPQEVLQSLSHDQEAQEQVRDFLKALFDIPGCVLLKLDALSGAHSPHPWACRTGQLSFEELHMLLPDLYSKNCVGAMAGSAFWGDLLTDLLQGNISEVRRTLTARIEKLPKKSANPPKLNMKQRLRSLIPTRGTPREPEEVNQKVKH